MIPSVNRHLEAHNNNISWIEYVAHMWISTMQDADWLRGQGANIACARFEDLKESPQAIIEFLLTHCGLEFPDKNKLVAVLAKDSQAGTEGARDKVKPARWLTDEDLKSLELIIQKIAPKLKHNTTFE